MNKDNGGPAFPVREDYNESQGQYRQYASDGMTLRDYFAAKVMQGLMASAFKGSHLAFAEHSYKLADAMLAERAQ